MAKELGVKIREHREKLRWSQQMLAEFVGASAYQTVARWETGKWNPQKYMLPAIKAFLAIPPGTKFTTKYREPGPPPNSITATVEELAEQDRRALEIITKSLVEACKIRQAQSSSTDKSLVLELTAAADAHLQRLNQTQLGETALRTSALVLATALRKIIDSLSPQEFAAVRAASSEIDRKSGDTLRNTSAHPQRSVPQIP